MRVQINGETRELTQDGMVLAELIQELSLAPQRIAVEVNHQIARRVDWDTIVINDGDRIEIVHFVGGGGEQKAEGGTSDGSRQQAGGRKKNKSRFSCFGGQV